jgi:hypothetical protein
MIINIFIRSDVDITEIKSTSGKQSCVSLSYFSLIIESQRAMTCKKDGDVFCCFFIRKDENMRIVGERENANTPIDKTMCEMMREKDGDRFQCSFTRM